jgi:hypothetical protein
MFKSFMNRLNGSTRAVDAAFRKAMEQTGAVVDSETAKSLKKSAINAAQMAKKIGTYLTDVNGDGKVDAEDIKAAAEKAGIAWNKIDPDLKTALIAGGTAGIGINFIPLVGQALAVPAFTVTTAYFFLVAKLRSIGKRNPPDAINPPNDN